MTPFPRYAADSFPARLLVLLLVFFQNLAAAAVAPLKVGVWENEPLVFLDQNGRYSGLAVEMFEYVAEREMWTFEYVPGAWSELLTRLENGEIDLLICIAFSHERAQRIRFNRETVISNWGLIYKKPGSRITSLLDLEGRRVAFVERSIHASGLTKLLAQFGVITTAVPVPDFHTAMQSLEQGAVDAAMTNRVFSMMNAHHYDVVATGIVFNPVELRYAAANESGTYVLEAIDRHLEQLKNDKASVYYQALDEWLGNKPHQHWIPSWVFLAIGVVFGVLALALLLNAILRLKVKRRTAELMAKSRELEAAHAKAEEEKLFLNGVINNIKDGIIVCDAEGQLRLFNSAILDMLNISDDEPVDRSSVCLQLYRPNGHAELPREQWPLNRALEGVSIRNEELVVVLKDGEQRHVLVNGQAICCKSGGKKGAVVSIQDITERIQSEAEREQLQRQLQQAQKMEAIGQLTGGIAHDFNNILASIMGYTGLARERNATKKDGKLVEYLGEVYKAGERARDLITQMLAFSRGVAGEAKPLNITPLAKEAVKMLRATFPSSIRLNLQGEQDIPLVKIDPIRLHQIIVNLCINARDAVAGRGSIDVILRDVSGIDDECASCHGPISGGFVEVAVADSGRGVEPELLARMFDPFFTTKEAGRGSGMGLSMVHGFVHEQGGHILVETMREQGTVVRLLFPRMEEIAAGPDRTQPADPDVPNGRGNHRILVVDDEESVARYIGELLETRGYRVTVMSSSVAALERFRIDPYAYDLILTDHTMPGLTGAELAQAILAERPMLPVILCTGYSEHMDEERALAMGIRGYLTKPLDVTGLLSQVRSLLPEERQTRAMG